MNKYIGQMQIAATYGVLAELLMGSQGVPLLLRRQVKKSCSSFDQRFPNSYGGSGNYLSVFRGQVTIPRIIPLPGSEVFFYFIQKCWPGEVRSPADASVGLPKHPTE